MRKLAFLTLTTFCVLAVLTRPDAAAQGVGSRCKSNTAICIGDKNNDVYVGGNLYASSPDGGSVILTPGALTDPTTHSLVKTALLDAGSGRINGNLEVIGTLKPETVDAGAVNVQGILGLNRPVRCGANAVCGTVALSSASPSTATATVEAGSVCVCWPIGTTAAIAAGGCAANVSSTTATFTGPNTVTTTIRWMCFL